MSQTQQRTLTPQNTPFKSLYQSKSRVQITFPSQGKTKQSFKDECDINRLMARYQSTGELPNLNALPPQYLDVTEIDFQAHQNFIAGANSLFGELPSSIRNRFNNSPGEFLDFVSQEKNRPELAEMGLLRPIVDPLIPAPQLSSSTPQNGSIASGNVAASDGQKKLD